MFEAFVLGVFFILLLWVRARAHAAAGRNRLLQNQMAEIQQELEKKQHRSQQLIGLLSELHDYKVSTTGRVAWKDLADFTVQTAGALVQTESVVLLKWDPPAAEYHVAAARGLAPQQAAELRVQRGEGILGKAAQGGKMLAAQEAAVAPGAAESFLTPPYLILPLWVHSHVEGLLAFCRPAEGKIGPEQTRLATLLAKQLQLTMENLELYEDRERVYGEIVESLATALAVKDPGSRAHADHCRSLVSALAKEMTLPNLLREQIEYGALLHDIGKLGVDQTILLKPAALTEHEYAAVKKHPAIGYDLLRGVSFFAAVAPIVLYHQEWFNGQGYPEGLAGEEIPLGSRMIAVAEAWDTMTRDNPYRKALPKTHAIAELRQLAGTQFDPKIVDLFLRVIDRWEHAEADSRSRSAAPAAQSNA